MSNHTNPGNEAHPSSRQDRLPNMQHNDYPSVGFGGRSASNVPVQNATYPYGSDQQQNGWQQPYQSSYQQYDFSSHPTGNAYTPDQQPVRGFATGQQQPVRGFATGQQPVTGYTTGQQQPVRGFATGQQQPVRGFATGQQQAVRGFATGQQPPVPPQRPNGSAGSSSPKRPQTPTKKLPPHPILKWIALAAAIVILIFVMARINNNVQQQRAYEALVSEVTAYDNVFCRGVYVDGINIGGMTPQQAADAIMTQANQRRDSWYVQLVFQNQLIAQINANQLGMNVDVNDAINDAWVPGHTGSVEERKAAMDALLVTPYHTYSTLPSSNATVIDSILGDISQQFYIPVQDAAILSFDASKSVDPFTYTTESMGRELDVEPVKEQIYQMLSSMTSGVIELKPTYVQPTVTVANLAKTIITTRSNVTTDISTSSTEDRNKNIIEAMRRINGTVVKPGGIFSFNSIVGQRTLKNGFYMAPEYTYGQEVMGVGGGVCQASTTVYQAAVKAGMEIVKRDPHSMEVRYAAWGTDATVNSTPGHEIDLKFRNNTDYPIYIKAGVESKDGNRKLLVTRVTIYGQYMGDGVSYNFATELEPILPPEEAEIRVDKDAEYVMFDDETYIAQEAKEGLKVTSYQVRYVSGFEQNRTFLDTDTYKAKPQVIYIGAQQRPADWVEETPTPTP